MRNRVPVSLSYPKASDASELTSKGTKSDDQEKKILTLPEPRNMNINGEVVPVYVVGENGTKGTITVRGFAKDMFSALPVGFYASRWNDLPTAMTLHSINVWLPKYDNEGSYFNPKYNYTIIDERKAIKDYNTGAKILIKLYETFTKKTLFDNQYGILRTTIEGFVDNVALMTFKQMVANGYFNEGNVVVLDENPVYKEVTADKIDGFLKSFTATVNEKKCVATCAGLTAILLDAKQQKDGSFTFDDEEKKAIAEETANAIYYKLQNTISKFGDGSIDLSGLLGMYFESPTDLMRKLRDSEIQVIIETRPYEDNGKELNPIVFWGFHSGE